MGPVLFADRPFFRRQSAASFTSAADGDAVNRWLLVIAATLPAASSSATAKIGEDCTLNGIRLFGRVQIVDSFPDIKVEIVKSFPDLRVIPVASFPDQCGRWRFVDSFPDFKIQYVESFPDLKIEMVESFPGPP